jgi:hypothetical protein
MQENSCLKLPQISNQLWCLKNEQHLNMDKNFDHPMSLSKSKCWFIFHITVAYGTASFKKCKQLFEYQHLQLPRDI